MEKAITVKLKFITIVAFVPMAFAGSQAHAANLVKDQFYIMGSEFHDPQPPTSVKPDYHVSLNSNSAGFAGIYNDAFSSSTSTAADVSVVPNGTDFQVGFTEAIQGYRFVNADSNAFANVAANGVSITMTTTDGAFDSFNGSAAQLWTESDPGADLLSPATSADASAGLRDISDVSGSIDISGLSSGTVFFFYGDRNATPSLSVTMGALNIADAHRSDLDAFANRNERYMTSVTFVNDLGATSIDYAFAAGLGGARWDGIVVTGTPIPETSVATLLALSALPLLLRRRR